MASTSKKAKKHQPFFRILTEEILEEILPHAPGTEEDGQSPQPPLPLPKITADVTLEDGQRLPKFRRKGFQPETMACVPMVEVDTGYDRHQTFVAFGKNGTIHRYSARDSLFLLSPLSPLRKASIFLSTNWGFSAFMVVVVIINSILLESKMDYGFDYACTAIYIFEFLLKVFSRGLFVDKFTCLRNPWTWLDIVVILTSLIRPFGVSTSLQWVRILKIIPLIGETRRSFRFILESIKRLSSAILLSVFCIFLFGIIGLNVYLFTLTQKCIKNMPDADLLLGNEDFDKRWNNHNMNQSNWYYKYEDFDDGMTNAFICGNASTSGVCPEGYTCLQGYGNNPNYGYESFDNIFWAMMSTTRIIMQDVIDVLLIDVTSAAGTWQIVYFILIFFFATYGIGTLAYALIGVKFFRMMEENQKLECDSEELKHSSVSDAPTDEIVNSSGSPVPVETSAGQTETISKKGCLNTVVNHWAFEVLITFTIIVDILSLTLDHHMFPVEFRSKLSYVSLLVCLIYLIEFSLKLRAQEFKGYFTKGWNIFDFVIVVHYTLNIVMLEFGENSYDFMYRVFKIIPRWASLHLIFKIIWNSLRSLKGVNSLFFIFWFFFALFGKDEFGHIYSGKEMLFLGGEIPRWNFVDFTHSFMTVFRSWFGESIEPLWDCMLVSNWSCVIYFSIVSLSGLLIILNMTIGVVYITVKTMKASYNSSEESTFSKIGKSCCFPCSWLKGKITREQVQNALVEEIPMKPESDETKDLKSGQEATAVPASKGYRRKMQNFADGRVLQWISIVVIIVASIILTFETVSNSQQAAIQTTIYSVDILFAIFFAIVSLYKLVSFGPKICFQSCGWIFDLIILGEMVLHLSLNLYSEIGYSYSILFFIRSLRPFMLLSRIERLEVVLRGILSELSFLQRFILAGLFIWLYFAIVGMAGFSGTFYHCVDPLTGEVVDHHIVKNMNECDINNFTWVNSELTFDIVPSGFVSWALIAASSAWYAIMFAAFDSTGVENNFRKENSLYSFYFFVAFCAFGVFYLFSILFGLIYYHLKQEKFLDMLFTKDQLTLYKERERNAEERIIPRPEGDFRGKIYDLVSSIPFDTAVMITIVIDNILLATDTYDMSQTHQMVIDLTRLCITLLYIFEMILKMIGWGNFYLKIDWNRFDFIVVVFSIADILVGDLMAKYFVNGVFFRIGRLFRFFQFKPLLSRSKMLQHYFNALARVGPSLWNIIYFQGILMFSYSLFGISVFGNVNQRQRFTAAINFGSFIPSINALYLLSSFNGIETIRAPLINEVDCDLPDYESNIKGTCGHGLMGNFFVFSYLFFSFLIFLNLYFVFILEIVSEIEKRENSQLSKNGKEKDKTKTDIGTKSKGSSSDVRLEIVELKDGPELQEVK